MKTCNYCCRDATALEKMLADVWFYLQSAYQKMMQTENASKALYGRWFREKIRPADGDRLWPEVFRRNAAERGRSEYPSGLVLLCQCCRRIILAIIFGLAFFLPHPILLPGGRKAPKRNMLAAATAGLAKNQIA